MCLISIQQLLEFNNKLNLNTKKLTLLIPFLAGIFVVKPVHAYAGPGVAIGAIIVFFTVIITI